MNPTLKITNGTDKEIRFEFHLDGESKGELMLGRAEFTKLCDLLYGESYTVGSSKTTLE